MRYIAVHHTAVNAQGYPQLYAVNRYHKKKWGMRSTLGWSVAYNYFIDTDGSITNTRKVGEETIANKGHNCDVPERCDTISVCLSGNFNSQRPNEKQQKTLRDFIITTQKTYGKLEVVGHRDIQSGRTCPGANVTQKDMALWNDLFIQQDPVPVENDHEDQSKSVQIRELQSILDGIRARLKAILKKLSTQRT